ncbi:MAG: hypothetical protein DI535_14285 [Citrobacter freundii]|nr:MAG: hypothetical protein DI535_14285 [Citrobacter freundii]
MKHWIISLLAGIVMLASPQAIAGRCTGKANCMACTNCSSCRYCNEGGGSCGKCGGGIIGGSFLSSKWPWIIACGVLAIAIFNNRKKDT